MSCLKKALCGLKQAALQWWRALDKSMEAMGFKCLKLDSGVFVLICSGQPEVIVIIYVDDAVFMGPQKHLDTVWLRELTDRHSGSLDASEHRD